MESIWHDVAYNELNSSIAGTLGNITVAMAMATRTELDIETDFPRLGSYDTTMNMITRGDPERVQGRFSVTMVESHMTNVNPLGLCATLSTFANTLRSTLIRI
jgi:hypothetical protein